MIWTFIARGCYEHSISERAKKTPSNKLSDSLGQKILSKTRFVLRYIGRYSLQFCHSKKGIISYS